MATSLLKRTERKNKKREKYHALAKTFSLADEPQFKESMSDVEIQNICGQFSFYRINISDNQLIQFLITYMKYHNFKSDDISFFRENKKEINPIDYGILISSRIWMNAKDCGYETHNIIKSLKPKIDIGISFILSYIKEKKEKKSQQIKRTKYLTALYTMRAALTRVDELVDSYICSEKKPKKKEIIENYIKHSNKLTLKQIENVKELCTDYINILQPEIKSEEKAYTKNQITRIKTLLPILRQLIVALDNNTITNKPKPKIKKVKPKKKKQVKLDKVIYKKSDDVYNIESVAPKKVVESQIVYVFDTKKSQIIMLVSNDESGFSFSGSKITNVDLEKSKAQKIKGEKDLPKFISENPKSKCKARLSKLKSKPAPSKKIRCRLNENMIILKVFK